jgi:cytochrome c oxidase cbb3-type subunit I/II
VIFTPNKEYAGDTLTLVTDSPELKGLIAYLQKLGTNRGKWRDRFEPQLMEASQVTVPRSEEWVSYGKQVYERRCQGCHGAKGDGNGPAAAFMQKDRPRNFTLGVFKFRLTPSGSLPDDGDLLRTITRGVRGTAMPTWHDLPEKDRLAVIQYVKYELTVDRSDPKKPVAYFVEEPPKAPIFIGQPPAPSMDVMRHGQDVWKQAKCWECHGQGGKGDGEKAAGLKDDFGFPIPPANLTTGQFKSGASVKDIFRTMSTGLSGTPMPSFSDSLSETDRWALAYYVLSLSAFTDPLTGEKMQISEKDRTALNDPATQASESRLAFKTQTQDPPTFFAGEAWAKKHGFDFAAVRNAAGPGASPN